MCVWWMAVRPKEVFVVLIGSKDLFGEKIVQSALSTLNKTKPAAPKYYY